MIQTIVKDPTCREELVGREVPCRVEIPEESYIIFQDEGAEARAHDRCIDDLIVDQSQSSQIIFHAGENLSG